VVRVVVRVRVGVRVRFRARVRVRLRVRVEGLEGRSLKVWRYDTVRVFCPRT